jgi:mitochondrial chaperone BCS1
VAILLTGGHRRMFQANLMPLVRVYVLVDHAGPIPVAGSTAPVLPRMLDVDLTQLETNPLVSGGLLLMLVGAVLHYLRRLPGALYDFLERFFILKIEVRDEDEAYQWMQLWLADRLDRSLSISVVTRRTRPADPDNDEAVVPPSLNQPTVHFVPAVGTYFFWYRGRFVTLQRTRAETPSSSPVLAGIVSDSAALVRNKESFTLRIFTRSRALARRLIEDCRAKALPDDGKLEIRVPNYGCWSLGTRITPRPLASVILDGNQAGELLADMRAFLASRGWYERIGVPYRRGYLLYGPPGNGKTSVVKALAGELRMSIFLMILSDPDINDNRVNDLLAKVPERSIVLLEDIDCAFVKRQRANGRAGGLTFAGLLNAIDGVAAPEGRLIVMTTNHLDRLDPALIRPGRADVKLGFENATSDQAARLFRRFFPRHAELASEFAERIEDRHHSMATLQDYLMLHRDDPAGAVRQVGAIGTMQLASTAEPRPSGSGAPTPLLDGRGSLKSAHPRFVARVADLSQ